MNAHDSPSPTTVQAPSAGVPPTTAERSGQVIDAFVTLAEVLVTGSDPADLLNHLVDRAVHLLGLSAAGILLAGPGGKLHVAAVSSAAMRDLEVFQLSVDDGPCLECFATGAPVFALAPGDAERRWPGFAPRMRTQGLSSVVAVPLRLRDQTLGAMGMFSRSWDTPRSGAVRIAQGLADVATISLLNDRAADSARTLTAQLQTALDSRVLIEQAKGVIAAQLGTTVGDAFLILRTTARHRGLKLAHVSQALVEGRIRASELDV